MDTTFTMKHPAVLAHPQQLFEPKPFKDKGKEMGDPLYSATFIFDPSNPDWDEMKRHSLRVAREEWPGIKWKEFEVPFKNGNELADKRDEDIGDGAKKRPLTIYRGKGIMGARSKWEPKLSYMHNGMIIDCEDEQARMRAKNKFFFGAEVLAIFNFRASEVHRIKRISVYVNTILANGKGTRLGGALKGSEAFAGLKGKHSDENPADEDDSIE